VLRGSSDDEPSPVKRERRKARLKPGVERHTCSGTRLSAARPVTTASSLRRSNRRSWTSISRKRLPDAISRPDT